MSIDPALLIRRQPPLPPRRDRGAWVTAGIFVGGTVFFVVFFLLALGDAALTQGFLVCTGVLAVGAWAAVMYDAWQENGLLGALWFWDYPIFATAVGKDWSWRTFAVVWLLLLSGALCGVLLAKAPGAVPVGWFGGRGFRGP
jgi:hypothetical protein